MRFSVRARAFLLAVALSGVAVPRAAFLGAAGDPAPARDLAAFVAEFRRAIPGADSGGFVEPAPDEVGRFRECIEALFAGEAERAAACLEGLGYELLALEDPSSGKTYEVAIEKDPRPRGAGLYATDPAAERDVVIGVPHPLYDVGTAEEGCAIFRALGARALFIAGAHRCAAAAPSPCRGTTEACGGGPHRISDAAHATNAFFQAAHAAACRLDPRPVALSIHGHASEAPDIIVSDGTDRPAPPEAFANRLRAALLRRGVRAASCNFEGDRGLRLCGTTNVQGRLWNGSRDPCALAPPGASGLFLHLEQSRAVRKDPRVLIEALLEVLPARKGPPAPSEGERRP